MRALTAQTYVAARVFDATGAPVIEQGFVQVEDGHIARVGKASDLGSAASSATDLGDVTLLPGLVNTHTHLTFSADADVLENALHDSHEMKVIRAVKNARLALHSGVTTIRDCGSSNPIVFAMREASAEGLIDAPHVWASGEVITSTGGHCYFFGIECDSAEDIRRAVRRQVKAGADFIKVMATGGGITPNTFPANAQFTRDEMMALTEDARRLHRRVAAHCHGTPGIRNAIDAEVTTIEHCSFMTPDGVEYEAPLAQAVADKGIYVCPTISTGERMRQKLLAEGQELPERWRNSVPKRRDNLRRMYDLGVKFIAGSDAGVGFVPFDDFQLDLEMLVEHVGMPNNEAIMSATSVAAEAIGSDEFGTLEAGKRADMIAVHGNPLHDIGALRDIRMVMKSGAVAVNKQA